MSPRIVRVIVVSRCDFLRRHWPAGQRQGPWRVSGPGPPWQTQPLSWTTPVYPASQRLRSRRRDAVD